MKRFPLHSLKLLSVIALFISIKGAAQNPSKAELYPITQVAPNAASLGKYGEYPVGLYTGTPNITIPLYELSAGRVKLPISLSYHAGGIKVEEIASSVGLGWSLNAGGVITRSVMGLPDENYYLGGTQSFLTPDLSVDGLLSQIPDVNQALNNYNYLKKIIACKIDGEPDVFYFNFGNMSGKFMYHQGDHKFYSIPFSKLRIEFTGSPGNSSFTLTDEKGIQYLFGEQEISHRDSNDPSDPDVPVTTSWYLSTIFDPVSAQTIYFTYQDYTLQYETLGYEAHYFAPYQSDVLINPKQNVNHYVKRLISISDAQHSVNFDYQQARCDLPGDYALTSIRIYGVGNDFIKKWDMNYGYFYESGFMPSNCTSKEESVHQRLKLLSVEEKPSAGSTLSSKPYLFEYEAGGNLPSRFSKAQDHWGFYNGQITNQHLYPPYQIPTTPVLILPGGNRKIVPGVALAGTLSKITYPTGGHTDFTFENNTASADNLPPLETGNQVGAGAADQNNRYMEVPFTVASPSSCDVNPLNGGVMMTLTVSGLDVDLLQSLYHGLALTVSYVNVDTNVGDMLFQYDQQGKMVGSLGTPLNFVLPNGNYKLIFDCTSNPIPESYESATALLSWTTCTPDTNHTRYAGGIRVKKIVNYKDETNIASIKSYKYNLENNPSRSSGQTQFNPQYVDHVMYSSNVQNLDNVVALYTKQHSSSNYPLVSENGKAVGYSNVIELNGEDDSNGYTQYQYTNFSEHPDVYNNSYSNSLPVSYQWLRGLELGRKVYKKSGQQLKLLSETINEYDTGLLGNQAKVFNGIRGVFYYNSFGYPLELPGEDMLFIGEAEPAWENHPVYSDFVYLKRSTERLYDNNSAYVENIKDYTYNTKNLSPSITQTTNSAGDKVIAHTIYPLDYTVNNATDPKALAIKNLQDINMISVPIEQYSEKQAGSGNKRLTGGIYTSYLTDRPLVDSVFYQEIPASGVINYPGISITANSFSKSSIYKPDIIVERYDPHSNSILQQKKANGISHSYLWDYGDILPVAEVKGATYNDIAYTSFEAQSMGNWQYSGIPVIDVSAPTGRKVYNLTPSNPIAKNDLNSTKEYILSYWVKGTGGANISGGMATIVCTINGWTKYTRSIAGTTSISISGTETIDEIRLCPQGTQMTTYTYNPAVGMTSMTDAKGQTTYYEYDGFQRLVNIKDQYGNILKHTDYHYQNQ